MATTDSRRAEGADGPGAVVQRRAERGLVRLDTARVMLISGAALLAPASCYADRWNIDAGFESELTRTTNADLGGATSAPDTTLALRPRIRLLGEGAHLRVAGSASLNMVGYAEHTQASRLNPEIFLEANVQAIERVLFIDTSLRATQESANPFGARPEAGATNENSVTTTALRFAPRIEGTTAGLIKYRLESENGWTNEFNAPGVVAPSWVGYFGRHTATVGRDPQPFGWQFQLQESETRYRDSTLAPLTVDLARATFNYKVYSDLTFGLRAGHEHTSFATDSGDNGGNIYGLEAHW